MTITAPRVPATLLTGNEPAPLYNTGALLTSFATGHAPQPAQPADRARAAREIMSALDTISPNALANAYRSGSTKATQLLRADTAYVTGLRYLNDVYGTRPSVRSYIQHALMVRSSVRHTHLRHQWERETRGEPTRTIA